MSLHLELFSISLEMTIEVLELCTGPINIKNLHRLDGWQLSTTFSLGREQLGKNPFGFPYVKQGQDKTKLSGTVFIALTVQSERGALWIKMYTLLYEEVDPWEVLCLTHIKRQQQRLMLVYWDARKSVPYKFPSITMYANTSGNASVDADTRCGYALTANIKTVSYKKLLNVIKMETCTKVSRCLC